MPAAAIIPAVATLGSAGLGAAGGKKGSDAASKAANNQFQLQQQALQFGEGLANTGMSQAWTPAANYWNALLKGGNAAVQATGPFADLIRQSTAGAQNQIQSTLPQGGERNLALAQNQIGGASQISRLYAGMGPTAAQALGSLSGIPMGLAGTALSTAAPNVSAGLKYNTHAQEMKAQGAQGLGGALFNATRGLGTGKGGGGATGSESLGIPQFMQQLGGYAGPGATGQGVF